ncbi:2-oxoglutarate dehydrogenase E1 [Paenibacillus glucanolyticus]|uniref:2-oxoglutarate dehydrogenase E1 n=1 Tax=Paenibacillus glucanolyticus TaxID=59843 RepID=A0A163HZ97_9BACL|nr:ASCH domain-containing protein [Paenibacillus glucanolyticus]KZS45724.1 2-oxoglutarate dehydrogenase E1 [Paenibacillus glucanolyticus]
MKTITIIQPWATLIALGEKQFETRSWSTKHRGELAIHAGKKIDREACEIEPIRSTLAKHGYTADNLPTGAIVALCNLEECYMVDNRHDYGTIGLKAKNGKFIMWGGSRGNEYYFGDYSDGRCAWQTSNVRHLREPIPAKGMQGLWNWEGMMA